MAWVCLSHVTHQKACGIPCLISTPVSPGLKPSWLLPSPKVGFLLSLGLETSFITPNHQEHKTGLKVSSVHPRLSLPKLLNFPFCYPSRFPPN